jgi:phosphate transport system permease protein
MSQQTMPNTTDHGTLPEGDAAIRQHVAKRQKRGRAYQILLMSSLIIGIIALTTLLYDIASDSVGLVAIENEVEPATLAGGRPLESLSKDELTAILKDNVSANLFRRFDRDKPFAERSQAEVLALVNERVVNPNIVESWGLWDSLTNRATIEAEVKAKNPNAKVEWRSWINGSFLSTPMSSVAAIAGIRTAIFGSLFIILITICLAVPIGVSAAIYLEEYAAFTSNKWLQRFNQIIETNINNLAGVPSIIYGMLGLAIFVRAMEPLTSGAVFGVTDSNGRTIISAALTMTLLILPLIIINAREAIRAVPRSIRQASFGLGATRWQTIWNHVLPQAVPGILTGTILGVSRAIGETAPLIVIGASTFIVTDPNGIFSKFTALPIQIYDWTSRPDPQFRNAAAAAILVLLTMLLSLNAIAIFLRNYFRRSAV